MLPHLLYISIALQTVSHTIFSLTPAALFRHHAQVRFRVTRQSKGLTQHQYAGLWDNSSPLRVPCTGKKPTDCETTAPPSTWTLTKISKIPTVSGSRLGVLPLSKSTLSVVSSISMVNGTRQPRNCSSSSGVQIVPQSIWCYSTLPSSTLDYDIIILKLQNGLWTRLKSPSMVCHAGCHSIVSYSWVSQLFIWISLSPMHG